MGSVSAGFWNETMSHCTVLTQPVLMRLDHTPAPSWRCQRASEWAAKLVL